MTDDPWLKTSIMAKRGLAKGQAGKRHELTIEKQGAFHYVYGPYAKPVLTVDPGDIVVVETEDAFGGVITSEQDSPTREAAVSLPQSAMRPDRRQRHREGRLPGRAYPCRGDPGRAAGRQDLHHPGIRRPGRNGVHRAAQSAIAGAGQGDACRQGTACAGATRSRCPTSRSSAPSGFRRRSRRSRRCSRTITAATWTCPMSRPARSCTFPCTSKAGFLYVGDCHAAQGDGELSGVAIEQRATVTLQVDVIKGWSFAWPRLETENFIMTIGSARPLEDAARIAYRELVRWMSGGLRLRRDRRLHAAQPGRADPARQHGRSEIHHGRVDPEKIPGLHEIVGNREED